MAVQYYKIKKSWNGGKWDKEQKGAFTTYAAAKENFTKELEDQGYKIFDPRGVIVYPNHEITNLMLNDDIDLSDLTLEESDAYFKGEKNIHYSFVADIIKQYHNKLVEEKQQYALSKEPIVSMDCNGITIYKIPVNRLKFKFADKTKKNIDYQSYFNLGFFGGFSELGDWFTLPSGNLVADIVLEEHGPGARKYVDVRTVDGKFAFSACENGGEFAGKLLSTVVLMKDGTCAVYNTNDIKAEHYYNNVNYAVSGVPFKLCGNNISRATALAEGWGSGTLRGNTYHPFLATKNSEKNYIYYFICNPLEAQQNLIDKINNDTKSLGFDNIVMMDGGGSSYFKYNGSVKVSTSENRQVCSIAIID